MTVTDGWIDALDSFEAMLELCSASIEVGGDIAVAGTFAPPIVHGPLPDPLRDRAAALLARAEALRERLQAEQDRIRAELARLPREVMAREARGTRFEFHS